MLCTNCRDKLVGLDYYYIVGASENPACSYECALELPMCEYKVDKMINGKKQPLDSNIIDDLKLLIAIELLKK